METVPGYAEATLEGWVSFRHVELAHSILLRSEPAKNYLFGPLQVFAQQTVQLLSDLDQALTDTEKCPHRARYSLRE